MTEVQESPLSDSRSFRVPATRSRSGLVFLCLLPVAWLWYVAIDQLSVEWSLNPQYSYGWAVPFLCVVLLIRATQESNRSPARSSILHPPSSALRPPRPDLRFPASALLIALCSLFYAPVRLIEIANPGWRLVSWGLALTTIGVTLLVIRMARYAFPLRHDRGECQGEASNSFLFSRFQHLGFSDSIFPLCFFLVSVPWPTLIEGPLIQAMTQADTRITTEVMGWLGVPAIAHGNVIEIATGLVGIEEACSGIRSFQATLMISLFLGEWYRLNVSRRLTLVVGGFCLSFLFNLTRMSLLVWVASRKDIAAISSWHDPAGITILVACFLCLWALGATMAKVGRRKSEDGGRISEDGGRKAGDGGQPAKERSGRGLAVLAIELIVWIALTEFGVQWWYGSHESRLPAIRWTVHPPKGERIQDIAIAPRSRQILRYDQAHDFAWTDADGLRWNVIFLQWNPGRVAAYLARNHTPEVCMSAAGRTLVSASPMERIRANGLELPFYHYVFDDGRNGLNVFYCLWSDRAVHQDFGTASLNYSRRIAAVREGLRNLGQRSLEIAVAGASSPEAAEKAVRTEVKRLVQQTRVQDQ